MTPKQRYDARKAHRAKLAEMDDEIRSRTEMLLLLDMFDRLVTAAEQIASTLTSPESKSP
jgi:hypothetical protein